ncbi:hypothetical protein K438DRAFT_1972780 [Mycena galopus ATCC 62051]|nr:hypothetical protein K438DRAFT_1972780 [Mycena galopus ATCC 62051]
MAGSAMDLTYGAMLIGVLFATFFQGVLSVQAYIYYENFPDDLRRLQLLVRSSLADPGGKSIYLPRLLDVTHLVLICQSCYHYLITSWGDEAALLVSTPELDLHLIFVGMATLVCQGFFLHRIWTFSKRNWVLTGLLSAACLAAFGLEVAISAQIIIVHSVSYFSDLEGEVVAVFSVGGAVDMAIALVLVFYLQQGKTHFDRTNFVVARMVNYTVATGLATSILAVACLIAYLAAPHTFIFIVGHLPPTYLPPAHRQAMHFSLGRLYTNALLATLNSRRNLRHAPHTHPSAPSITVVTTRIVTTVNTDEYPMQSVAPAQEVMYYVDALSSAQLQ